MKKEATVKAHTRKGKNGKLVNVRQHTTHYESAEDMVKDAIKNKKGAGKELTMRQRQKDYASRPNPKDMSDEDIVKEWNQLQSEYKPHEQTGAYKRMNKLRSRATRILSKAKTDDTPSNTTSSWRKGLRLSDIRKNYKSRPSVTTMSDADVVKEYKQVNREYAKDKHDRVTTGSYGRLQKLSKAYWAIMDGKKRRTTKQTKC